MGGTENPLTCLLLPFIVLILEKVLVPMGENELILLRAAASCLTGPTEELLWTADPLVVEEGTLKLLGTTSWLFFTGGGPFRGVGSAGITLGKQNTNPWPPALHAGKFEPSFLTPMGERPSAGLEACDLGEV